MDKEPRLIDRINDNLRHPERYKGAVAIIERTTDVINGTDLFKRLIEQIEKTRNQS